MHPVADPTELTSVFNEIGSLGSLTRRYILTIRSSKTFKETSYILVEGLTRT